MAEAIERILDRVQLADPDGSRDRAVVVILGELATAPRKRRRRRWFGLMLSIGAGGLIAVSPIGQAVGDFFRAHDYPGPPPTNEDRALTKIACEEMGSKAESVSWCVPSQTAGVVSVEELLASGYMVDRYKTAIAVRSPDGTVLFTGQEGLDRDEIPEDFGRRWDELP